MAGLSKTRQNCLQFREVTAQKTSKKARMAHGQGISELMLAGMALALTRSRGNTMTMQLSDKITVEIARTRTPFDFFKAKTNRTMMVCVSLLFLEVKILKQRTW